MQRRQILKTLAATALAGSVAPPAWAQAFPSRPVKVLVGYGAGGNGDVTIRIVMQKLADKLGRQFVVENRPGPGGIAASQALMASPADGYTLALAASGNFAMTPSLFKSLPFDTVKDFAAVSLCARFGFLMAVNGQSPINSVADLIAAAKAKPGTLNFGTTSVGSAPYIGTELFKLAAGIDAVTVPFRNSGEIVTAVRNNDVQVILDTIPPVMPHFETNALKPLAVTSTDRFPLLPNVPTVQQGGLAGYELTSWNGIVAPRDTPAEVLDLLNREINAALQLPDVHEKFRALGVVPAGSTRQEFAQLIERDVVKWRGAIEAAKIEKQ